MRLYGYQRYENGQWTEVKTWHTDKEDAKFGTILAANFPPSSSHRIVTLDTDSPFKAWNDQTTEDQVPAGTEYELSGCRYLALANGFKVLVRDRDGNYCYQLWSYPRSANNPIVGFSEGNPTWDQVIKEAPTPKSIALFQNVTGSVSGYHVNNLINSESPTFEKFLGWLTLEA